MTSSLKTYVTSVMTPANDDIQMCQRQNGARNDILFDGSVVSGDNSENKFLERLKFLKSHK